MDEYLTFDDVALIPQYNNIDSRLDANTETWLTRNTTMGIPLVASNMDTVICPELAQILIDNGSIPIFHRFASFEQQKEWIKIFKDKCFISCGLNKFDETVELLSDGPKGVCIDIAHGHSERMCAFIRRLKKQMPHKDIIAGNVCTSLGYQDLVSAGADAVKVGVGCGAACTTRLKTGFGVPQFTAIREISKLATKLRVPIIADGGIERESSMCIALAAGASAVMCGKLFAKTRESACMKTEIEIEENGRTVKKLLGKYRGQASKDFQKDYYGKMKKGTVAEGVHFDIDCSRSAQEVLDDYVGALRSSMTYGGAKDIKEFQRKAEFCRVTHSYTKYANIRP